MRIELSKQKAFLMSVNARAEKHGDETEPAGDLKVSMELDAEQSKVLDWWHDTFRSALFFHDSAAPKDLAEAGLESGTRWPHVRFPFIQYPLKLHGEMIGGRATVHWGTTGTNDIELENIKVNSFEVTPKPGEDGKGGGIVELVMRIQAHPNEKSRGRLWGMIQSEIILTIEPPEATAEIPLGGAQP